MRVTNLPTGITGECQNGRSQHSNRAKAHQVLQACLQEKDRSDRIRTYNSPKTASLTTASTSRCTRC